MALYENGPLKIVGPNPEGKNSNLGLWSLENARGVNVANDFTLADAAFFAAAPELLEALTDLCDAWDLPGDGRIGGGKYNGNITQAQAAARAAIAKPTGSAA